MEEGIYSFQPPTPRVCTSSPPPTNQHKPHHNTKQAGDPRSFGTVGAGNARERESNAYGGGYGDEEEEEDNNVRVRFFGVCECWGREGLRHFASLSCTLTRTGFSSFLCLHHRQFGYGGGYPGMRGEHVQCSQQ